MTAMSRRPQCNYGSHTYGSRCGGNVFNSSWPGYHPADAQAQSRAQPGPIGPVFTHEIVTVPRTMDKAVRRWTRP